VHSSSKSGEFFTSFARNLHLSSKFIKISLCKSIYKQPNQAMTEIKDLSDTPKMMSTDSVPDSQTLKCTPMRLAEASFAPSTDLHKISTHESKFSALDFKSVLHEPGFASLSLFWQRVLQITGHHSEFLYERPRRFHRQCQLLMQFLSGDVASSETSLCPCLGLQNKKDPPGVGRQSLLRRSSQSSVCKKRRERERERARENNRF
jgi:hypothetical protein